jgi:hypothetical protein
VECPESIHEMRVYTSKQTYVRISRYCTVLFVLSSYLEGFESRYPFFLLQTSVDHDGGEVTFLGGEGRRGEKEGEEVEEQNGKWVRRR